jgi:hypothetical protein
MAASKWASTPIMGDCVPLCFTFNFRPTLVLLRDVSIESSLLSKLYFLQTFSTAFSWEPLGTRHFLPSLSEFSAAVYLRLKISTAHSSSASATNVFLALTAPSVLPWGRPPFGCERSCLCCGDADISRRGRLLQARFRDDRIIPYSSRDRRRICQAGNNRFIVDGGHINCANSLDIWVSCNVEIHHVPGEPQEVFDLLADYRFHQPSTRVAQRL